MDGERENVVQEFIGVWTAGLADAGVSSRQIYAHTAFLSRRAFQSGDDKNITYMKSAKGNTFSQHNHFAPPSVAFGNRHWPGFSTYPQPGLFEDIYEEVARHKPTGWASCEGTNMQPSSGPGQTGMNMETYLAKTFNHGGALVNIFAWGIGGEAMKTMDFRVVTEGEDALRAYRKFLRGEPLIEAATEVSLMERLPPKIHRIQKELPAWLERADAGNKAKATALMQKLDESLKAKNLGEVEKAADSLLKLMGVSAPAAAQAIPEEDLRKLRHDLGGSFIVSRDKVQEELKLTREQKETLDQHLRERLPDAMEVFQKVHGLNPEEQKQELAAYRRQTQEKLGAVLKEALNEAQRERLRQLERQREGLRDGEVWKDLHVTDEQRKQFMALVQRAQKETQRLQEALQKRGQLKEIQPRVIKVRDDLEGDLEALLSEVQKKQWKEMLGKPVDMADLVDL